jgi:hypothetical protein
MFVYLFQYMPAFLTGTGFGMLIGLFVLGIGASRQYMKGREDGYDDGREKGEHAGWTHGYLKGIECGRAMQNWEGGVRCVRKNNSESGHEYR